MNLTAEKREKMPAKEFAQPETKDFPLNDATHARLAIGGATRSYRAGNISKSEEERIQGEARSKLARYRGAK